MKWLKILFILIIGGCDPMAVYVPNTNTYGLTDVVAAVEDHAGELPGADSLEGSFSYSEQTYFDSTYNNDSYAEGNSLKRFRNYGPHNTPEPGSIFVPDAFDPSSSNPQINKFRIANVGDYPSHVVKIFNGNVAQYLGPYTLNPGALIYERTGDYDDFPWDGKYNGILCLATMGGQGPWVNFYTVNLEINGTTHTAKTFSMWDGIVP